MIYCFLADGFEEIEALATVDVLRRASLQVQTVSVNGTKTVTGSHNIKVEADILSCDIDMRGIECAIYPGGMPGAETLSTGEDKLPGKVAQYCVKNNILVGAICAAPLVLGRLSLLENKKATCYPGFENELKGAECTGDKVTVDGNIVTGRGPGCSLEFAFTLVSILKDERTALEIRKAMQCDD
ncbi:MAG: DJ-1/PfpI family protein [Ruminococcus sp.]|nr:DJ-1/PfpI family protein [Ruminococcus sp.]